MSLPSQHDEAEFRKSLCEHVSRMTVMLSNRSITEQEYCENVLLMLLKEGPMFWTDAIDSWPISIHILMSSYLQQLGSEFSVPLDVFVPLSATPSEKTVKREELVEFYRQLYNRIVHSLR